MTPEEYQRLKEAEKKHLQEIRELKGRFRDAKRMQGVRGALDEMQSALQNDEFEQSLRAIQEESAMTEARIDVALGDTEIREAEEQLRLEEVKLEAERTKQAAADLIAQMKAEMNVQEAPERKSPPPTTDEDQAGPKTIGRRIQPPE